MIAKPLNDISLVEINSLITNQVRESKSIEFKRDLPGERDKDKREFLADVSSFANSVGGDLIFGIEETQGAATSINGLTVDNIDNEILRLNNIIQSGLDPRLPAVEIHPIDTENNSWVLILRIRQSWVSPHRVIFNGHDKFYARHSAGKYPLDVGELRNAFTATDTIAHRIRDFRTDRLAKLRIGQGNIPIKDGAMTVLHLIPLSAFTSRDEIDLILNQENINTISPLGAGGWNNTINLDGYMTFSGEINVPSRAYTQTYRNGIIEAIEVFTEFDNRKVIPSVAYEQDILSALPRYLLSLRSLNIELPIFVYLSLINLEGYEFATSNSRFGWTETRQSNNDNIVLPEIIIDEFGIEADKIMKPVFNKVWNAFGLTHSLNYNAEGDWVGQL